MLTRGQVAKLLGKSIATVRRLEGHELHPQRDLGGVLRFDEDEVELLARQRAVSGERTRGFARHDSWLGDTLANRDDNCDEEATAGEHDERPAGLDFDDRVRRAAEEMFRRVSAERDRLDAERRQAQHEREVAELLVAQTELLSLLDACSPREREALLDDPEFADILDELLEGDD
jgi:hypothetical protein